MPTASLFPFLLPQGACFPLLFPPWNNGMGSLDCKTLSHCAPDSNGPPFFSAPEVNRTLPEPFFPYDRFPLPPTFEELLRFFQISAGPPPPPPTHHPHRTRLELPSGVSRRLCNSIPSLCMRIHHESHTSLSVSAPLSPSTFCSARLPYTPRF